MTSIFRGVFLTSDSPAATAVFYQEVAGLALERIGAEGRYQYWRLDDGTMQLAIHDATAFARYASPALAGSNLTHLYFKIENQRDFLTHLDRLTITPFAIDAVVVTVIDPDGRKVMFGTA